MAIVAEPKQHNTKPATTSVSEPSPYDLPFFLTFVANLMLMIAVSLLFRYSDFVEFAGGNEFQLGLIVGLGTLGAISSRVLQGIGVDALGPRSVWLVSLALYTLAVWAHVWIESVNNPIVYICRALMQCGMAGTFGASITFITLRVPRSRATEVIGILGTSGFLGMATGPVFGDLVFASQMELSDKVRLMFIASGSLAAVSLFCSWLATRKPVKVKRASRRAPIIPVVRRYSPGILLLVAAAMGMGIGLPGVFLRPYTSSLGLEQLKFYFIVYNLVGITIRLSTRRLIQRVGDRRLILIGLGALVVAMPMYLLVRESWQLAFPAIVAGIAHAFLFPAVVSAGGHFFPNRYRGIAIALMLGLFDLGNVIGNPLIGSIITLSRKLNLPPYPVTFFSTSVLLALIWIVFYFYGRTSPKPRKSKSVFRD